MPVIDCQPIHQIEGFSSYIRLTLILLITQQLYINFYYATYQYYAPLPPIRAEVGIGLDKLC